MAEKLLLMIQYECHRAEIPIPWDTIVHRIQPGSSGPAATQMLNKLRDILVVEGHMIPPPLGKTTIPQDPTIRGFIRDFTKEAPNAVRVVGWTEKIINRKESYKEPGVVCGSGNYVRDSSGRRSITGRNKQRPRVKLPEDYLKAQEEAKKSVSKSRRQRCERSKRAKCDGEERSELADPADLPSDEEWDPKVTKKAKTARRPRNSAVKVEPQSDGEAASVISASSIMHFGSNDEATPKDRSLTIKLLLSPEKLAMFPAGTSGPTISGSNAMEIDSMNGYDDDATDADIEYAAADEEYDEVDEAYEEVAEGGDQQDEHQFLSPRSLFEKQFAGLPDISYRGPFEHGTLDEYRAAIEAGTDPKLNGRKYKNRSEGVYPNLVSPSGHMTYAESVAYAQASSQASDFQPATEALFTNANSFAGAGIHHPIPTHLNLKFGALGLDPSDDPFVDRSIHTPPHAPLPFDMAQQLAGNCTPPYHTFAPQVSSSVSPKLSHCFVFD